MTRNPMHWLGQHLNANPDDAKFYWTGGPVEVAERTWFQSFFSGVTAFETDDGLVLIDTGTAQMAPNLAATLRQRTHRRVHTAIYTHGHVDHAYGLSAFLAPAQELPRVIAHRRILDRFVRYESTPGHNAAINARQFRGTVADAEHVSLQTFHVPLIQPDTLYDKDYVFQVGGLTFELHHCQGETDDHTWVWCPERKVLCPGDLFIYCVPNAGNPQKAQRYPWDWSKGLREMAVLRPHSLCPGHGGPVVNDPDKIERMLVETADYLDALVAQTIAALEKGSPPHVDLVRAVQPPPSDSPWLQPVYDEAEFIVRNVIRYYGGWWSGRPSELKPASRAAVAGEVAHLAGGAAALIGRAQELARAGDLQLACHLADWAVEASPTDPTVQDAAAAIYDRRAETEPGLMAVNLFRSAAAYARAGRPFS